MPGASSKIPHECEPALKSWIFTQMCDEHNRAPGAIAHVVTMESDAKRWLKRDGEAFLRDLGIRKGQVVLDFGCGAGHYAIPAAKTVGEEGRVYALDRDKGALAQVMQDSKSEGIEHIVPVATSGELTIRLNDESVDAVLLFDTLHYMTRDERRALYDEVYRVLRNDGVLLVYPKHHKMDQPLWNLKDMSLEEVIEEIESANFCLDSKSFKNVLHNDSYDEGVVLHFRKGDQAVNCECSLL